MSSLLNLVEEGDISAIKECFLEGSVDVDSINQRGDGAIHIVSRLGNHAVLKLLLGQRINVNLTNSLGDTASILAARHGDIEGLRILLEAGADLSICNKEGETCLHAACVFGDANLVSYIGSQPSINIDQQDLDGESALHIACSRGYVDCTRNLVELGATLDLPNSVCSTPLHLALSTRNTHVAMYLLHAGADCDIQDWEGDAPIHFAAREGLLTAVQTLCAFGCSVDSPNKHGLTPLHLASLHGHLAVVRCLCLAGCNIDARNFDGIKAEITAIKHGHNAIADLLNKLRNSVVRELYTNQLTPSSQPISRVNFKLLGHSGVGKTVLIESLQSGYFTSLFKRSKAHIPVANSFLKGAPSSPTNTHIEMDVTPRNNSLSFESYGYQYTHGISIKQVTLSGVGELTLWDFSGQDTYFLFHHHFLGCIRSMYAIVVSLQDTPSVQLQQACFWLNFLLARIRPSQSIGYCGCVSNPLQVVLVATHPDIARLPRDANGEYLNSGVEYIVAELQRRFQIYFQIHSEPFILDARAPGTNVLRSLRRQLGEMKQNVIHQPTFGDLYNKEYLLLPAMPVYSVSMVLPSANQASHLFPACTAGEGILKWTGLLEGVLSWLPNAVRLSESFPVMDWNTFIQAVRINVNPLAGDDHIKELCIQLQTIGEVAVLHWQPQDIVVLSLQWLCEDILGQLLSIDFLTLARVTGCYTVDDFQAAFSECDSSKLLVLLEQLQLCTQCENDGELEYEFPCFNMVETLDGLWDESDPRYCHNGNYIGLRLKTPPGTTHLLHSVFPRIQVQLRLATKQYSNPEYDLYQWFRGSKLCTKLLESVISLETDDECGESIEIKVRGPDGTALSCFYFMEDLLSMVHEVISEICPNLNLERHALSARQLKNHEKPFCFPPAILALSILDGDLSTTLHNPMLESVNESPDESLLDLIACNSEEVEHAIVLWPSLSVRALGNGCRRVLSSLMDPPDPLGKDWCLLAVQLGLTESVAHLDAAMHPSHPTQIPTLSQTNALLERWSQANDSHATLGKLVQALQALGREDAVDLLLRAVPLYKVIERAELRSEYFEEGVCCATTPTNGGRTNLSR